MQIPRRPGVIHVLAFACLLATPVDAATAQGTIRGVVRDSLRNGSAIADAVVELVGSSSQMLTDSEGRFEFRDVPPGRHTLVYTGKRLDSLGLASVMTEVTVQSGKIVKAQLATPSERTYKNAICGSSFHSDYGVLRGRATGQSATAIASAKLMVLWSETLIMPGLNEDRDRTMEAMTNRNGEFVFCGVPRGIAVVLMLPNADTKDTVQLRLRLDEPVAVRNVTFAPLGPEVRITGRVVSRGGIGVPDAVAANLVTEQTYTRADSSGRFQFTTTHMSRQLVFRAVGFTPAVRDIEPIDHDVDLGDVEVGPGAQIASVLVSERRQITADEMGFQSRRDKGLGAFIDQKTLQRVPMVSAQFISGRQTIAHAEGAEHGIMVLKMFGRNGSCDPLFFIDGLDVGRLDATDQNSYLKSARRIEIYRDATAPRQFTDSSHCGAIVIWTM